MECNKEEADRAKEIAEKKMESRDFAAARKVALMAQRLYPDLKDLSQIILVCDVHFAAQSTVYGGEKDWYEILQVKRTDDEATIKKQYRKLALLLHPDKNQFAGASDAFKFIGEAQKVLLDNQRRAIYDSKCKPFRTVQVSHRSTQQASRKSNVRSHPWFHKSVASNSAPQFMDQQSQEPVLKTQTVPETSRPTFWTICPICSARYEYYKEFVLQTLHCRNCKEEFIAYEMNSSGETNEISSSQPNVSQEEQRAVSQGHFAAVKLSKPTKFSSKTPQKIQTDPLLGMFTSEANNEPVRNDNCQARSMKSVKGREKRNMSAKSRESMETVNTTTNRNTVIIEDDDDQLGQNSGYDTATNLRRSGRFKQQVSCEKNMSDDDVLSNPSKRPKQSQFINPDVSFVEDKVQEQVGFAADITSTVIIEDDDDQLGQNSGYDTAKNLRRSGRFKQQVSCEKNMSDDDVLPNPSKRPKQSQFINPDVSFGEEKVQEQVGFAADIIRGDKEVSWVDEKMETVKTKDGGNENFSLSGDVETHSEPKYAEYPMPDFSDFEELRRVEDFSPGQLWALYDELDGMPRFYALIEQVMSPGFKVRITWLEPDPDDEEKIKWVSVGLPTSCGKFKLGSTEDNEHHGMFSHLANCERSKRRDMYTIYPRKGEIWAIFKDWDVNWYSTLTDKTCYEFEFVEILSDYADDIGIQIAYLDKIKGFTSLFCRTMKEDRDDIIPTGHMFKFSHKVPSFRMSGKEGKNVPAGSFELDPASLPSSIERIDVFQNLNMDNREISPNPFGSKVDILKAKHDLKPDGSSIQSPHHSSLSDCRQLEASLMGKDSLANEARPEASASLAETTQVKAEELDCLTPVKEAVKISQVDLKFKEGGNLSDAARKHDHPNYNSAEEFTEDVSSSAVATPEDCQVPDPDFHNFDADKTSDKFKVGQMWAMYCDEDALPKYYAIIKRIDSPPQFKLYVTWLAACSRSKDVIRWVDKKMPISCGNFKMRKTVLKHDKTSAFSHEVKAVSSKEKDIYVILPQKGDVWSLYKDFNANITLSDLKRCKYEIVEVLEKNETSFKVLVLERVKGFKSVFKPKMQGSSTVNMLIPLAHQLRFANQVPAVRQRGFWETDAAALPKYMFNLN